MESNLVDIIKSIVEQINTNLPVLSIDGEKIYLCNTLHLTIGKTIKDATDKEYKIKEFKINEYIVVEPFGHTDPFTGAVVVAPSLTFLHGDPKSTNNEYQQLSNRTSAKTPFIWLVESYSANNTRRDSAVDLSFSARVFLLDWANTPKWTNTEHNDNVIKPMENLLRVFLQVIDDDYNFKRLDTPRIDVRPRFGDPIGDPTNLIIDEDLSGIDVSFNLEVYDAGQCCTVVEPINTCIAATNTLNGNQIDGTLIATNKNISIVDDLGAIINPTILNDTKTNLDLEIVGGGSSDLKVYYNRPDIVNMPSYATYDEGDLFNTNYDPPFLIPNDGVYQQKDLSINEDYLFYNNVWGHKFRLTSLTGGYYDFNDGQYKDVNGNLSTFIDEFRLPSAGVNNTDGLIVDHLTGLSHRSIRGGAANYLNSLSSIPGTVYAGYSDYRSPTLAFMLTLWSPNMLNFLYPANRQPFQYNQPTLWSCTPYIVAPTTTAFGIIVTYGSFPSSMAGARNKHFCRIQYQRNQFVIQ